ncbi:MAG: helix-turn-helix transcriptional regulator [Acidimicrobiia bacterium]
MDRPGPLPPLLPTVTALTVDSLARELLLYLDDEELSLDHRASAEAVLHAAMKPVSSTALHIPIPADPRARAVAEAIIADPADARDLADWAWQVHTTERTLRRLFTEETSISFTQWRLHVRVRAAMQLLAAGHSVGVTARKVGYGTAASFVTAFVRVTGTTPAAHCAAPPALATG